MLVEVEAIFLEKKEGDNADAGHSPTPAEARSLLSDEKHHSHIQLVPVARCLDLIQSCPEVFLDFVRIFCVVFLRLVPASGDQTELVVRSVARIAQDDVLNCMFCPDYIQKHTTRVLMAMESFCGVVEVSVGLEQSEAALDLGARGHRRGGPAEGAGAARLGGIVDHAVGDGGVG